MGTYNKYADMKQEDFDRILAEIVKENAAVILTIPDVYSELAEYFNNEVLERWEAE